MGSEEMKNEFPDSKQRAAVCYGYWKNKDKKKTKSSDEKIVIIAKADFLGYTESEVKDTLLIKFKLCHANRNMNGECFTVNELYKSYRTAESKAICFGHNKTYTIGFIAKSLFINTKDNKLYSYSNGSEEVVENADFTKYGYTQGEDSYIYCEAIMWKNRYPEEAEEIRHDFEDNDLFFSMETYFSKCQCSVCNAMFDVHDEYCEHLEDRYVNGASRILLDCTFAGAAKVEHPADRGAVGLSAANNEFTLGDLIPDDKFNKNVLATLTVLSMEE
jgi:hypothetical protein